MAKQPKKGKTVRNKFKDTIWDYYTTNREITKEYDAIYEEEKKTHGDEKKKWTGIEKLYLVIILIGVVLIVLKYLVF